MEFTDKSPLADTLGALRAEAKRLGDEIKAVESAIKAALPEGGTIEGHDFRVTVSVGTRKTVAWKKIALDLGASGARIRGNTKTSEVTRLDVRAHAKAAA